MARLTNSPLPAPAMRRLTSSGQPSFSVAQLCEIASMYVPILENATGVADPSQVKILVHGTALRAASMIPVGSLPLIRFVVVQHWQDIVDNWQYDLPEIQESAFLVRTLTRFSNLPALGTSDGTWGTSGEFGELVRLFDASLRSHHTVV